MPQGVLEDHCGCAPLFDLVSLSAQGNLETIMANIDPQYAQVKKIKTKKK